LKQKLKQILHKSGVKSSRTKNIVKHVAVSFFYKAGTILASFLLVPIAIDYLDTEDYGVWLTISSFIACFTFFDIGLGNGLRNRLTEALANNNLKLAKAYVSSAYFTIIGVGLLLFLVFFILNFFIDWQQIFNTSENINTNLNLLMIIVFGSFSVQLIANLISTIYLANQNHSIQVKIHFITQVLSLIIIWLLTKTSEGSLLIFAIIFSVMPVIILLVLNFFGFNYKYQYLKLSIFLWKRKYLKDIMGIGFSFFIIQIAGVVLYSTDNLIISKLFSPNEVVPYNIAFKYFSILTMVFTIIVTPYWSSFTEAIVKKEYIWIKTSIKSIMKIWLLIPILLIIMIVLSDWFYFIWVGDKINISIGLSISMAVFVLLFTFNSAFVFFINGTGKIKMQLYLSLLSAILNIPLSIYLAKNLNLGIKGVILATILCYLPAIILMPIQYFKLVNNKATGIWNK
jgi:O-antigen/teichoic acid export membrane protein